MPHYDVVVVGGGPAGSAAAVLCVQEGLDVLLLEKQGLDRHKPCGGVLPSVAPMTIEDILDVEIPEKVMERPAKLGLCYVPPSGMKNQGVLRGYEIHNVARDKFDQWLRYEAEKIGTTVHYNSEVIDFNHDQKFHIEFNTPKGTKTVTSEYLIGADGVRSRIRKSLCPDEKTPVMLVGQEDWTAEGEIEDYFYGFFREDISKSYAYLIPKEDHVVIGLGTVPHSVPNVNKLLTHFKDWLSQEIKFKGIEHRRREVWAIPFGYFIPGKDNVLLVGDAAGLCNPLSGEGIRLAVESAEAATYAIVSQGDNTLVEEYKSNISGLVDMVKELNEFVRSLDNSTMEDFVQQEASRTL